MQWDHLPGVPKLGDISNGLNSRSRDEILDEMAKCELVCANCHVLRTISRAGRDSASGKLRGQPNDKER